MGTEKSDLSSGNTSVVLRVRRTVVQDAYIAVPVSGSMKAEPESDGSYRIDFDALVTVGVQLSHEPGVEWRDEQRETTMHPLQGPVPTERTTYRPERKG